MDDLYSTWSCWSYTNSVTTARNPITSKSTILKRNTRACDSQLSQHIFLYLNSLVFEDMADNLQDIPRQVDVEDDARTAEFADALRDVATEVDPQRLREIAQQVQREMAAVPVDPATERDPEKDVFGHALYPKIQAMQPERAGKLTGMILEMDNEELHRLTTDDDALRETVEEALTVYEEYHAAQQWVESRDLAQQAQQEMVSTYCVACMEQVPGSPAATIHQNDICQACFDASGGLRSQFKEHLVNEDAPVFWAGRPILIEDVRDQFSQDFIERYQDRMRLYSIPAPRRLWCATPDCEAFLGSKPDTAMSLQVSDLQGTESSDRSELRPQVKSANQKAILCKKCEKETCSNCTATFELSTAHSCLVEKEKHQQRFEGLVRGRDYQLCPDCARPINLRDGCNHITCTCRTHFCYLCGGKEWQVALKGGDLFYRCENGCPQYNGQPGDVEDILELDIPAVAAKLQRHELHDTRMESPSALNTIRRWNRLMSMAFVLPNATLRHLVEDMAPDVIHRMSAEIDSLFAQYIKVTESTLRALEEVNWQAGQLRQNLQAEARSRGRQAEARSRDRQWEPAVDDVLKFELVQHMIDLGWPLSQPKQWLQTRVWSLKSQRQLDQTTLLAAARGTAAVEYVHFASSQ